MSDHASHAPLLQRLLERAGVEVGTVGDAFEASELASCPSCRRVLDAHLRLLRDLEALAEDERASLALAARIDAPSGGAEAELRAHVLGSRGFAGQDGPPPVTEPEPARAPRTAAEPEPEPVRHPLPASRARRALWLGLAAAVLLFLGLRSFRGSGASAERDRVLGPRDALLHPVGRVESYVPFRWDVELPEGGHFVLRIEGEGLEHETGWLRGQEWSPAEPPAWPPRIRWQLEVRGPSGPADVRASFVEWAEL